MTSKELRSDFRKIRNLFYEYKPETRKRHRRFKLFMLRLTIRVMFWKFIRTLIKGEE